jgi:hypothetical protein
MSGRSIPIPIRSGRAAPGGARGTVSASVPVAPVIGSLPPPSALSNDMPDLSLPATSPQAFSLVRR